MKLDKIQALEWLVRDFNKDNRLVVEVSGRLVSPTFLRKLNNMYVTDDSDNYNWFHYDSKNSTAESMSQALRQEFKDSFGNYDRPEVLTANVFKRLINLVDDSKVTGSLDITPVNAKLIESNIVLPFFIFDESTEFNPVSVIQVAK